MTSHLSAAVTRDGVLEAGLAELRGQFGAPRVLAAVWDDDGTPALTSEPAGTEWDELPVPLRAALESVRSQPLLQISAPAGPPAGAGTAVEYSGNVAALWIELDGGAPFGLEDRTLLALLCGRLGQALNRVHLLDQQREVALALQHALLGPARLPPGFAVRYEPATPPLEIGGDWYDIAELPDGRIGIIVGDCVGRGLAAASVMGQLRSACRALLLDVQRPAQALTALDRFATLIPDALCSTVFCAVLDPATGQLSYASAGHPPGSSLFRTAGWNSSTRVSRLARWRWRRTGRAAKRWCTSRRGPPCCCTPMGWWSGAAAWTSTRPPAGPRPCSVTAARHRWLKSPSAS